MPPNEGWRLVIAEDAENYIGADARRRAGWALIRLLNLTDGLFGQGLDVLVLITTNEDVGRLHPAVLRAGRCLARTESTAFSTPEARAWLGRDTVRGPITLADLHEARGDTTRLGDAVQTVVLTTGAYV